ncbi:MAG: Tyrosine recombinase XerC [candidate division WS2 bacterium]|uniref:Tyrosine recombinase XerC n=1 Tax=Psychracetigena formicireducens TaxID=2986056 RepID=A0A9E2BFD2_PSYF1|nr:Tyrosine recombinase XerC [Candidatus Psychracetigena formicireducens]
MLHDFIKIYIKNLKSSGKSPKTISTYSYALQKYNKWRIENTLLIKEVGRDSILRFRNTLLNEGLKPATVNLCLNVLYSFYDFLSNEGYLKGNPVNIKKNRLFFEYNQVKPFTAPEIIQIEAFLTNNSPELRIPILLLLSSGLSVKELTKLTPADIVLIKRHIFLKVRTSSKATRLVPLKNDETARELLILIINNYKEFRVFPVSEKSIKRYLNFISEQVGIIISFKKIRKNYTEHLINTGCPRGLVRWIIGYRSALKVSPEDLFPYTVKV